MVLKWYWNDIEINLSWLPWLHRLPRLPQLPRYGRQPDIIHIRESSAIRHMGQCIKLCVSVYVSGYIFPANIKWVSSAKSKTCLHFRHLRSGSKDRQRQQRQQWVQWVRIVWIMRIVQVHSAINSAINCSICIIIIIIIIIHYLSTLGIKDPEGFEKN